MAPMTNETISTVVPSLAMANLKPNKNIVCTLNNVRVGPAGNPLPFEEEGVHLGRWGTTAALMASMNDEGYGPRADSPGQFKVVQVAAGVLSIVVMETRLIGSFMQGQSFVGALGQRKNPRAVTFSWPYADMLWIHYSEEEKKSRGSDGTKVNIGSTEPVTALVIGKAIPLNENWTGDRRTKPDHLGLATSIARAAASWRKSNGDPDGDVDTVIAGAWQRGGNWEVVWLGDQDSDASASAGHAPPSSDRKPSHPFDTFPCSLCEHTFESGEKRSLHEKNFHPRAKVIPEAETVVLPHRTEVSEMAEGAPGTYPCRLCTRTFVSPDKLTLHMKNFHT